MSSPRGEVPPSSRTAASSARPKAGSEHSDDAQHASLSTTPTQSQMQPLTSHSNPPSASKPTGSTLRPNTALRPAIPAHDTTSTSTTPAQRHQPSASSFSSASDRNIGSYDDSNNNATIGRGQANVSVSLFVDPIHPIEVLTLPPLSSLLR